MKWSKFQEAIFAFLNNNLSFVVSAVAGSGKTTTIIECAVRYVSMGYSTLFLAFNKSTTTAITEKLQRKGVDMSKVLVKTFHALGYKALSNAYKGKYGTLPPRNWLNDNKYRDYLTANIGYISGFYNDLDDYDKGVMIRTTLNLFDKCRVELCKHGETNRIDNIAEHYNIDLSYDEINVVNEMLKTAYSLDDIDSVDFTDMICKSAFSAKKFLPKYDKVIVDECQDLNNAEREMLLATLKRNGTFIAVGDAKQAINGFAGASCDSFDILKGMANGRELPLSVCYRCGSEMIRLAQDIVPEIRPSENAISGEIRNVTNLKGLMPKDMILCRKTAPLVNLCLKLIANGISAKVKGREIGKNLITMVEKTKAKNVFAMSQKLEDEAEKLAKKLSINGIDGKETPRYIAYMDRVECIKAICDTLWEEKGSDKVTDVIECLTTLFEDDKLDNCVTLSTIHKAKGLEADNVYIIVPNKLPLTWENQKSWEFQQEMNLKYVAITRAMKTLTFVNLDEEHLASVEVR